MAERVMDQWTPRWWEPEVWPGAAFHFVAQLHGLTPGAITGGAVFLDGREFPVHVSQDRLQVSLTEGETVGLAAGGAAQLYLDVPGSGRVLWLNGTITGGGR